MASQADLLFGKIAIMNKMVTKEQVDECVSIQERFAQDGIEMTLGEVLQKKKFVTEQQIQQILHAQRYLAVRAEDVRLGELAVRNGMVAQRQVADALALQESAFRQGKPIPRLGELLTQRGLLERQQLEALLKAQKRLRRAARPAPPPPPASRAPAPAAPAAPSAVPAPEYYKEPLEFENCTLAVRTAELERKVGQKAKTVIVVEASGAMDAHSFPHVEQYLAEILDDGQPHLILNCENLTYISSAGIGVLIHLAKRARDEKGDLRLCCVPKNIQEVLELIGLQNMIRMYELERGAAKSFTYL